LSDQAGTGWDAVVSRVRGELRDRGCSVLPNFLRPPVRDTMRGECAGIAARAHYDMEIVNAYNTDPDPSLPEDHPGRTTFERGNAFVARDLIPPEFVVNQLYTSRAFQRFIAACFELDEIHELGDPLSSLCLNVVNPGMAHPWHFDTNDLTVSMLTQEPEDGGSFEYCPGIRSSLSENFADVRDVLAGSREDLIRRLALRPGDLQLFKGRYALHRVTEVHGDIARHSAIFAYSERPGVIGSVARTRQLFGRVLPEHLAAEGRAARGDHLLD
jgi:hypothetical protein